MRYECTACRRVKVRLDDGPAPRCPKCRNAMQPGKAPKAETIKASRRKAAPTPDADAGA